MPDALLQPIFVLLWSSGYVVGALASQVSGPVPLLATRFILASLVTVPVALRSGRLKGAPLRRLAVIGLLFQVIQFGGIYGGFALGVPAGLSALVMLGLSPLVTTGLAIAGGQETHDWRVWSGLVIGIAGVAIGLIARAGAGPDRRRARRDRRGHAGTRRRQRAAEALGRRRGPHGLGGRPSR